MYRVLNKKGIIAILEPSEPFFFPLKQIYKLYFYHILPIIGGWISKDKKAYSYLPESVSAFPSKNDFLVKLRKIGFNKCEHIPLTFGIVSLYIAIK